MVKFPLHPTGSTGNSRASVANTAEFKRAEVELVVEAVGATPTITFAVQGLRIGGDPTVAADWQTLAVNQADATVASSSAAIVATAVGKTVRYIAGIDTRPFDAISVNATANTNVTFSSNLFLGI